MSIELHRNLRRHKTDSVNLCRNRFLYDSNMFPIFMLMGPEMAARSSSKNQSAQCILIHNTAFNSDILALWGDDLLEKGIYHILRLRRIMCLGTSTLA